MTFHQMEVVYTRLGQENPEDTNKLHEEVAYMSMIPPFATFFLLACTYGLMVSLRLGWQKNRFGPGL